MLPLQQSEVEQQLDNQFRDHYLYFSNVRMDGLSLSGRIFNRVIFKLSNLNFMNMANSTFIHCMFTGCKLSNVSMEKCKFEHTHFNESAIDADFFNSTFTDTHFNTCKLNRARFNKADTTNIVFSDCSMAGIHLSGAITQTPKQFMDKLFKRDEKGWIVYKGFGCEYMTPDYWSVKEGGFIEEAVNPDRTSDCGCGINFATISWIKDHYNSSPIWKCRVNFEDACGIVVPYGSTGKARCDRLEILERITTRTYIEL